MDVLVMDSVPSIVDVAQAVLAARADHLLLASDLAAADTLLEGGAIDVVICDPTSDDLSGHDAMGRSFRHAPDAFRIAVFRAEDPARLARVVNECKPHYCLCHPVSAAELNAAMTRATEHLAETRDRHARVENKDQWTLFLENRVIQQSEGLAQAVEDVLCAMVTALDIRENESAYHSRRVALSSLFFAIHLEVDPDQYEDIYYGSLLHDVGKIGIRDAVLLKPDQLTAQERHHIKSHIEIGVRLLSEVERFQTVLDIPHYHHERYDGTGYPTGKAGEDIPLSARMFAILDVYDALVHERPYKRALSHEEALAMMHQERGSHFDARLIDSFLDLPDTLWTQLSKVAPQVRSFTDALLACHHVRPQQAGCMASADRPD